MSSGLHTSPLFLDGWIEFNRTRWGVRPLRVLHAPGGSSQPPLVEAMLYLNPAGQVVEPHLNPYLPVAFVPTESRSRHRRYRQWLMLAEPLVRTMRVRGVRGVVRFPPEITDIRPWQWAGFRVTVRYTIHNEFPYDIQCIDAGVRNKIRRAQKAHYTCRRTVDMNQVLACLRGTQQRQGIDHGGLTAQDFECIRELLGDEAFRVYACYAPDGAPASVRLILHRPGSRAIAWMSGVRTEHLQSGAAQLLIHSILEDLQSAGAAGLDFAGADVPSLAAAKLNWGGHLVPLFTIEAYTVRNLAKWVRDWIRLRRDTQTSKHLVLAL